MIRGNKVNDEVTDITHEVNIRWGELKRSRRYIFAKNQQGFRVVFILLKCVMTTYPFILLILLHFNIGSVYDRQKYQLLLCYVTPVLYPWVWNIRKKTSRNPLAFSWSYDLAPRPPPPTPPPVSSVIILDRRHTGRLRKRDNLLTVKGGKGGGGAESYDRKTSWSSINYSILSDWKYPRVKAAMPRPVCGILHADHQ